MRRSISQKLILQIMPVVLVIFVALTVISILMAGAAEKKLAYEAAFQMAENFSNDFNGQMSANLAVSRNMSYMMAGYQNVDRENALRALKNQVEQDEGILGAYVGYEPNAFDNRDAEFVDQPGHD
ncbi:MAG TPA: hypothetical protein PLE14_10110, partial [Anaerolineales bacterium]|nr:hypothetical protein [Anaerolineales bacterium]